MYHLASPDHYSRVIYSRVGRFGESSISAVLETELADSGAQGRRFASCTCYLRALYHCHSTTSLLYLSVAGKSHIQTAPNSLRLHASTLRFKWRYDNSSVFLRWPGVPGFINSRLYLNVLELWAAKRCRTISLVWAASIKWMHAQMASVGVDHGLCFFVPCSSSSEIYCNWITVAEAFSLFFLILHTGKPCLPEQYLF
jgi:hypothetical protein